MIPRRRFLTITAAASLCGAAGHAAPSMWRGRALGAEVALTLRGAARLTGPVMRTVEHELRRIEAQFSLYDRKSAISRLNATGTLQAPDPDFVAVLRLCGRIHHATGGVFDPTIQPLWRAHATGGDIAAARDLIGWQRISIAPDRIRLGAGQALTLNGIAQGWASDRIAALLRGVGFDDVLVDIGEFVGHGGPWRIGIGNMDGRIVDRVTLQNRALATSSPGALRIGDASHILSAKAGGAALWSTVSVEADTAAIADGLSTACCFLSKPQAIAACRAVSPNAVPRLYRS